MIGPHQQRNRRFNRRLLGAYGAGVVSALVAPLACAGFGLLPSVGDLMTLECVLIVALLGPPLGVFLAEFISDWLTTHGYGEDAAEEERQPRLTLQIWREEERPEPRGQTIRLFPAAADTRDPLRP